MSYFGKNIKKIRSVKNLSQQRFADLFDLKRATLGAYEEGRSEPKIENIIRVANYFSISIDDILTRELTVNELLKFKDGYATETTTFTKEVFPSVPCITESNREEYISEYSKPSFIKNMCALHLPLQKDKQYRAYQMNSLEMTSGDKGFYPNDIIIGEYFALENLDNLQNGTLILCLVANKLILRRAYFVHNEIVLKAEHKNIEDKRFSISEIKEIWLAKYSFFKRIPDFMDDMEDKLSILSQELSKIKKQLDANK